KRNYALSLTLTFLTGLGGYVGIIFMPRFFQTVHHISATWSGYYILPALLGMMAGAIVGGQLVSRIGRYKWILSASLVFLILGSYLMTHLTVSTADWTIWVWLLPLGLGIGPMITTGTVIVQSLVPAHRIGAATGSLGLFNQIGAVMGLAVVGSVFSSLYERSATPLARGTGHSIQPDSDAGQVVGCPSERGQWPGPAPQRAACPGLAADPTDNVWRQRRLCPGTGSIVRRHPDRSLGPLPDPAGATRRPAAGRNCTRRAAGALLRWGTSRGNLLPCPALGPDPLAS